MGHLVAYLTNINLTYQWLKAAKKRTAEGQSQAEQDSGDNVAEEGAENDSGQSTQLLGDQAGSSGQSLVAGENGRLMNSPDTSEFDHSGGASSSGKLVP